MEQIKFSFLISTKNRCEDLLLTLNKIKHLLNQNVTCVIFDDGSTDDTFEKVRVNFSNVTLLRNEKSKGYIYCRNKMLNETEADFVISLDDDAHFLTEDPIEIISGYFRNNPSCGLIATRIFWGKETPENTNSAETTQTVKSYIGCGHIWRIKAWRDIPDYPEWFEFYGEENFASLQLFKKNWEIHYIPQLLVQHRVDMDERAKLSKDIAFRYRRAIRADWYTYFMLFPWSRIPRKMAYSLWMQFRKKIFKGNFKVAMPLVLAIWDLFISIPKLIANRNALTLEEYDNYLKLNEAKIYWKPEK
jgi:glycosyltransferase involved in cell wall biosynthesis